MNEADVTFKTAWYELEPLIKKTSSGVHLYYVRAFLFPASVFFVRTQVLNAFLSRIYRLVSGRSLALGVQRAP